MDALGRVSMKDAANRDRYCELQNSASNKFLNVLVPLLVAAVSVNHWAVRILIYFIGLDVAKFVFAKEHFFSIEPRN